MRLNLSSGPESGGTDFAGEGISWYSSSLKPVDVAVKALLAVHSSMGTSATKSSMFFSFYCL